MSDKIKHRKANKVMTRDRLNMDGIDGFFNAMVEQAKDIEGRARALSDGVTEFMEGLANSRVGDSVDHDGGDETL